MAATLILAAAFLLQPPPQEREQQDAMVAVRGWLASDFSDRDVLQQAVDALLSQGEPGFRSLAGLVNQAVESRDRRTLGGLEPVITTLCLDFMKREVESEMVYAGQYDPLLVLMPHSGRFYLGLLLDTPDWFPDNLRWQVVAALRDLYPESPGDDSLAAMQLIAEDQEFETEDLREALTHALAQWGRRRLVERQIAELERNRREALPDDQLDALQQLADVYYRIRDYKTSAELYKEFLELAEEADFPLAPAHYYNAACTFSLTGDLESAYEALEACAELQSSDHVDSSLKLERELFDTDPEIRAVRGTRRFEAIVEKAFGKKDDGRRERGG